MADETLPSLVLTTIILLGVLLPLSFLAMGWMGSGWMPQPPAGGRHPCIVGMCGGGGPGSQAPGSPSPNTVEIRNYAFSPAVLKVPAGTTITWINYDGVVHTVSPDPNSPYPVASGPIATGGRYAFRFDVPGTYGYHCEPHPYMQGTIVVS